MYSSFELAKKYLYYYLTASNSKGHGMHSPFVYDFTRNVLNNKKDYRPPNSIEELREELNKDHEQLEIEDLGAGSRKGAAKIKTVTQLAYTALKPKKYARLLYRLAKHYQPQTIVELGTCLGLTTAYFSNACPGSQIITIEGSTAITTKARANFKILGIKNIQSLQGDFDNVLPGVLAKENKIDLAYIDGNHRYEPTMRYFHQFLHKTSDASILVFDDIHWSNEMERAWSEIKEHPAVQYTIDVFFLGFVFFRKEFKVKQHFKIRF
ncbi:MAG TPA: class I SAM-dependent methyltransferase [Flavisolibacter sp.]|nr:class I SAM-dependent methyltransferase [Flavisolibacter sp.]